MSNRKENSIIVNVTNLGNHLENYLVFDSNTVKLLRDDFRICGRLIGSITNVSKQAQTSNAYLPLKLSRYEFDILIDMLINNRNDSIRILNSNLKKLNESNLNEFKHELSKYNESLKEKKRLDYLKQRREQLLSMKEKILEGKRNKLLNQLNSLNETDQRHSEIKNQLENLEASFNLDLEQTAKINENTFEANTEIFTHTPEFYASLFPNNLVSIDVLELRLNESLQSCKFKCYKYFYEKGFYLTCGAKFGGDFLAYPGDPAKYHAQFIIAALDEDKNAISLKHLITFGRMATSVKKTYVLAYELNNKLNFISLNWSHF